MVISELTTSGFTSADVSFARSLEAAFATPGMLAGRERVMGGGSRESSLSNLQSSSAAIVLRTSCRRIACIMNLCVNMHELDMPY